MKNCFLESRACLSLMRAVPKKIEPERLFFAKPGLSEFHKVSAQKTIFRVCFLQSRASLSFIRAVWKNIFLEPEALFFCKAGLLCVSKEQCGKNIFLEPEKLFCRKCNPC